MINEICSWLPPSLDE